MWRHAASASSLALLGAVTACSQPDCTAMGGSSGVLFDMSDLPRAG